MRSFGKRITWLCILLTLWSAVAFAAHDHPNDSESLRCSVCVAAHSTVPSATVALLQVRFVVASSIQFEPLPAEQRVLPFALNVRPPPQV